MKRAIALFAALAVLSGSAAYLWPRAEHALALRLAADEPGRLADLRLAASFNADVAAAEIAAALAADDVELAASFIALADARAVRVAPELRARLAAAGSGPEQARRSATRFGRGLLTGNAEGIEGIAGAATGDLFIYGDLRDLGREGWRWAKGEDVDPLMAGLAGIGLAVTAGTYLVSGAGAPARAGVTLFKAARRTGKIGINLAADMTRIVRSGSGGKAAAVLADIGRIESKVGARAALESMKYADDVGDLAKVGKLAERNGSATLAVLKTLGRGAIALGAGAVTGALWVLGAATNIFLLVVTLSTLFAMVVRGLWRTGRFAYRGGRYAAARVAATA